jgi:hypothetical protein
MLRRWWPLVLLLLVPLLPLWRAVFLGQAIGEFDHVRHFAPWNGPTPETPWDVLQADGVLQFYVWRDLVFESWGKGLLPLWNPYSLAGTPLLGNSQSAALYPPHILMGLLHVPTGLAMVLLAWLHLAWAGLGVYALVRRLGGSKLGAAVGGMLFALSPFMVAWTGLPSVITTVSWIPWVLMGVAAMFFDQPAARLPAEGSVSTDPEDAKAPALLSRERRRQNQWGFIGLAVSIGMLILSGHLQFVAYGVMAAVLLAILLAFSSAAGSSTYRKPVDPGEVEETSTYRAKQFDGRSASPLAGLGEVVAALLLGAMIAAPQLLTVLSYSQFSHRRTPPTSEGYAAYVASAVKPFELASVAHAPLVGLPTSFAELPEDASVPPMAAYWPIHAKQGANFAESAVTLGPFVLSLLLLAPWRKRAKELAPIAVVGVVAWLLGMGTIVNALLYYGIPGWAATGSPGRVMVLFVLAGTVLAGLTLGRLPALPASGPKRLLPLLLPLLVVVPFALLGQLYPSDASSGPLLSILVSSAFRNAAATLLGAIVVSAAAVAAAFHLDRKASKVIVLATPLLLFALSGGLSLVRTGDPSFLAQTPLKPLTPSERIAVVNDGWGLALPAPALAPPNTPAAARIHDLSGYDSLMHRDSVALVHEVDGQDAAPSANGNMQFVKPTADPGKLAAAGVTEVWSRKEMPQLGQPLSSESGIFRYRVNGPGRASTPQGPAEIVSESSTGIKLKATGPGRLVLRDRNMPGWLPKIDGRHVPLEGTTWLEVDLPAGEHSVEFNYVPPGFMPGVYAAALAWLAVLAVFLSNRKRSPHNYLVERAEVEPK